VAATLLFSGSRRSTEKTAAASVDDTTAPKMSAVRTSTPRKCTRNPDVTATLTATPTVASSTDRPSTGLIDSHRVVKPPSVRMIASATKPSTRVRSASSYSMPAPDSPSTTPSAR